MLPLLGHLGLRRPQVMEHKLHVTLQLGGCAPYALYQRLAELQLESGDEGGAGESYEYAAEAAMEAGKAKIAMKLQALAEQYAAGDGECLPW